MKKPYSDRFEPATDRDRVEPGDKVFAVSSAPDFSRSDQEFTKSEETGRVREVVTERTELSPNNVMEKELAIVETDSGGEKRVSTSAVNSEIEGKTGSTLIPLRERDSGGSTDVFGGRGGGFRGVSQPTDIGREPDGEFETPDTAPDVDPAPINRNTRNGRFGLDPFDLTSGGVGESLDLFDSGDR